ncbi:MAG: peptide chain release factor 1 [Elusimicrobia bacterium]|nr:peptide chain release factor 1 [Elusimicrobiota bacterium]
MNPAFDPIEVRYHALQERLADPVLQGTPTYNELAREYKGLELAVQKVRKVRQAEAEIQQAEGLLSSSEPDLRALAEAELKALRERVDGLSRELEDFLVPRDPRDGRDVIIEIRAGTGGDEAAIFAGDLFRMYSRYGVEHSFIVEPYASSPSGLGGFKEIVFGIKGPDAYARFKHESGVHRVQRVPDTEASGRIHTSTATVAVLPEADEVEVTVNPADLRIDTYRASGAGGQHVNKTESAIRITHLPSGIVVACQEERSQVKNRARAFSMLRAKLYQSERDRLDVERRDLRRSQVGTGERTEKIRTYNFPQDRVTDHRINQNCHNPPGIREGHMDDTHAALWDAEKKERLARVEP